ncbi:MAG: 16S rRNA (adenine(1518)-N(6)/adenine(1519)-N(6))-dimethyltransferase RsmA [Actinomycetales bacterium]|nr:16S rRNA (adenine(1518)-N(6)/adenine(1519)-N(6))-dimethyltransferase RsmA [Actinomycetales bacterium]
MAEPDAPMVLLGGQDIRELASRHSVRPTKQRGQNFVTDPNTVRMIVSHAQLRPDDVVVEVGPGLGSLTFALLQSCAHVVAVEVDETLAAALPETVAQRLPEAVARLLVVNADALSVRELPQAPTAMVSNLPYNVAVPVLLSFLERFPSIERVLVMVQAEVADRLAAKPGSRTYGVPSVKAQWYAEVRKVATVGRNVFWPAPNVDSALVFLQRRAQPAADRARVFSLVDAGFAQRRKTLRSALAAILGGADAAADTLTRAGIDPGSRAEVLSVDDWARLAHACS